MKPKPFEPGVAAYQPLALEKAAHAVGLKRRNASWLNTQPVFLVAYSQSLAHVHSGHKARSIETMAAVMDDPGEKTVADRTIRLKATQAITQPAIKEPIMAHYSQDLTPEIIAQSIMLLNKGSAEKPDG